MPLCLKLHPSRHLVTWMRRMRSKEEGRTCDGEIETENANRCGLSRDLLGWHLCITKLPRKVYNSKTETGQKIWKMSQNFPKNMFKPCSAVYFFTGPFSTVSRPASRTNKPFSPPRICKHRRIATLWIQIVSSGLIAHSSRSHPNRPRNTVWMPAGSSRCCPRKWAEFCFESTVSEKRTHWASLSFGANSVSSAKNSVSSLWHTNLFIGWEEPTEFAYWVYGLMEWLFSRVQSLFNERPRAHPMRTHPKRTQGEFWQWLLH